MIEPVADLSGLASVVDGLGRGCLFVSSAASPPMGWPLAARVMRDALWTTSYRKSAKVAHIQRSDDAVFLLFRSEEECFPYDVVCGRAEVVEPTADLVAEWSAHFAPPGPSPRVLDRLLTGRRVFIRLIPGTVQAFRGPE